MVGHQRGGDRGDVLGQLVLEVRRIGDMDLADALHLRSGLGDRADVRTGDQQVDLAELRRKTEATVEHLVDAMGGEAWAAGMNPAPPADDDKVLDNPYQYTDFRSAETHRA